MFRKIGKIIWGWIQNLPWTTPVFIINLGITGLTAISVFGLLYELPELWTITLLMTILAIRAKGLTAIPELEPKDMLKKLLIKRWVILWAGMWFIVVFLRA